MLQYEYKQMNSLINEKYDLTNMLNSTINSALSITQDNILHLIINYLSIKYL